MRKSLILIIIFISNFSFSQKTNKNQIAPPNLVQEVRLIDECPIKEEVELVITENTIVPNGHKKLNYKPIPKDGLELYIGYLKNEYKTPENQSAESGYVRTIIAQFVIEKDGSLSDIKIIRGNAEQSAEFTRVLKKAPHWKPGLINDKPVRVIYTIPFRN